MIHHPWCNYQNPFYAGRDDGTAEGTCEMCNDLIKHYPLQPGDQGDDLRKRHFPNVKVVRE